MRIEQQKQILEALQQSIGTDKKTASGIAAEKAAIVKSASGSNTAIQMQNTTYLNPAKEEKKSIAEKIEASSELDAFDRKNQMAVLSNTVSEEDYARMQEEGFSLESTDAHTIITVTDKIKMQLAKAGKKVFGDGLDAAQLEEMTGSAALAQQLEHIFDTADLPVTEENIEAGLEAFSQSQMLGEMSDGAIKYMLDNHLEPTIENIYKAQYSGSAAYRAADNSAVDFPELMGQIENKISEMGFPVNETTMEDSRWLVENEIPLTEENLSYYEKLKEMDFPTDGLKVADAIVNAVAEGKTPKDALLVDGYSLKDQAEHAADVVNQATEEDVAYIINHDMELTVDNLEKAAENRGKENRNQEAGQTRENYTEKGLQLLTAKRQLEEVRLAMTAEANYALLKKGISIDTEPLVKLVDELKKIENDYYANLLASLDVEASPENVALFAETEEKVQQLGQVPAYVLGVKTADVTTIDGAYEQGMQMKEALEKAGTAYETLMTRPRADMGDSMQKAFRNVEDILADLGMDANEENARAVRILGYNGIDITNDSILQMKAADEEVQRMFSNMTPAVVTQLIKRGVNPLEMKFPDLNRVIEQIRTETGKDENEKFSEYLYKLERNHQISEEERSSYIGIYRLIHQVEQTDGAAIGALVHQGAELTMKNLLTAVRSSHKINHMDLSVDDENGATESGKGISITEQIETAYQTNCVRDAADLLTPGKLQQMFDRYPDWQQMSPEEFAQALFQMTDTDAEYESQYLKEQMQMIQNAASSSEEIYRILEQFDLPNTAMNVTALDSMLSNRNRLFRQLLGEESTNPKREKKITSEDIEDIKEKIIEDFGEAISEPEELAKMQETLGKVAENVMKTMIDSDHVTSIDIRNMRLMQAQLSVNQAFAKKEQYSVPVLVGDKVTNVSLKIVRDVDTKGIVDIMLENELSGKIAATFRAKEEGISGLVVTDKQETRQLLADHMGLFASAIQESDGEQLDLRFAVEPNLDLNHFSGAVQEKKHSIQNDQNLYDVVQPDGEDGATQIEKNEKLQDTESSVYKVQTTRLYHIAEAFIRTMSELS